MNIIALILAIVAAVVFFVGYSGSSHRFGGTNLGLGLLTTAWIVQLVWESGPVVAG
jgi:hypothetical protein